MNDNEGGNTYAGGVKQQTADRQTRTIHVNTSGGRQAKSPATVANGDMPTEASWMATITFNTDPE